jgi:hypothetical protein
MAAAIPWIIGAAAVGATAFNVVSQQKQAKEAKKDAAAAAAQNAAAIKQVKDAQKTSGEQAQQIIARRRSAATQTIYTSPLGVSTEAATAKKVLLGQ